MGIEKIPAQLGHGPDNSSQKAPATYLGVDGLDLAQSLRS